MVALSLKNVSDRYSQIHTEEFTLKDPTSQYKPARCRMIVFEENPHATSEPFFVELHKQMDDRKFKLVNAFTQAHNGPDDLLRWAVITYGDELLRTDK